MVQNLKNQLFEKIAKELGVEFKCYTAPYHPQSNGKIEGFHHFLKSCMTKHISTTNGVGSSSSLGNSSI